MGQASADQVRPSLTVQDRVLYGADRQVAQWVAERIGGGYSTEGNPPALGVVCGTSLGAGVIYERFNGIHCEVAIAAEPGAGWASREVLRRLFSYPFQQLGCAAMTVLVPMSNLPSMNLAAKLGFEPEALIRFAAYDGSDLIVMKAWRDKCRWINHGQKKREPPVSA